MKRFIALLLFATILVGTPALAATPSDWAIEYVQRALSLGLLPPELNTRFTEPITREEFCAIAVPVYERAANIEIAERLDFADCQSTAVAKIGALGVVRGVGGGKFAPELTITREEAAVFIDRLFISMNRPLPAGLANFSDADRISLWARDSVGRVQARGIMVGGGDNAFSPGANLTIEQTIKTMLFVYDLYGSDDPYTPPPNQNLPAVSITDADSLGRRIPILMYHAVAEYARTSLVSLFVRPSELEAQFKFLVENGFQTITFDDLDNIGSFAKPILLTFDDGYFDNYTELFPLLQKYKLKATIFIITDAVWAGDFMTEPQLKEMHESGLVSFQSHTKTHPALTSLPQDRLRAELLESKLYLEALTGKPVTALCYPAGGTNWNVRAVTSEFYRYAVLNDGGQFVCGGDLLAMVRVRINRGVDIGTYAALVS